MRNMIYQTNKLKAKTVNTKPSLTDQAGARDTDINVIVGQFMIHGQLPGTTKQPIQAADFTNMPTDLRGFIEMGKAIENHRAKLPAALAGLPTDKLLALTPEQLKTILTPREEKPKTEEKPKEETK